MCALEAEEGFAEADDGRRIYYRVSGKGPFAVVMPVNWGMDSYIYSKGLSSLEFYLALVTWDPRGVGKSDPARTPSEFALERTADDAASVADALALPRAVVIGHSSGGAVALTYALRHPSRASHLVLISAAPRWETAASSVPPEALPTTEDAMRAQMREAMARAVPDPSRFLRAIDEYLPRMHFSPERLRWASEVEASAYDVRARLSEIRVPTLIVHGGQDTRIPPRHAEDLHAGIPGSRLVVFQDCGHWPFVERRAEFVAVVKEFLGLENVSSGGGRRPA